MPTLGELEIRIAKLQQQADALRVKQSAGVVANIQALMAEYGLTVADLTATTTATASEPAKRGRGRPPGIAKRAVSKKSAKAGFPKGKMPPKYRDPVTGATWSGHSRPPTWISDAPDRNVYLIDRPTKGKRSVAPVEAAVPKTRAPYGSKSSKKRAIEIESTTKPRKKRVAAESESDSSSVAVKRKVKSNQPAPIPQVAKRAYRKRAPGSGREGLSATAGTDASTTIGSPSTI